MMGPDDVSDAPQEVKEEYLEKMMVAYDAAAADVEALKDQIEVLNREIVDKEIEKEGLENLLANIRSEKDEMEVELAKARTAIPYLEDKLEKTSEMLRVEEARTGRIMDVAEEIHDREKAATAELGARDDWFQQHMQLFEDLNQAIETRIIMIDRAVTAAKELADQEDTFREMRESVIDAIKDKEEEAPEEEAVEEDED
jgi:predicted  nucleic acid-binding Zn-ribbon protein|tara:strand:- start:883 stop:1479 length:597 start_codon:yes stop_codon:yes gene_type:complete